MFQSFDQITTVTYVLIDNFCPCLIWQLANIMDMVETVTWIKQWKLLGRLYKKGLKVRSYPPSISLPLLILNKAIDYFPLYFSCFLGDR